jgi:hypothetical protein
VKVVLKDYEKFVIDKKKRNKKFEREQKAQ